MQSKIEKRYIIARFLINFMSFIANPTVRMITTWLLVIFCAGVGVWWALATNKSENFSRMGSIIVIISLTTYVGNFEKILKKLEEIGYSIMTVSIQMNSANNTRNETQTDAIDIAGSALGRDYNRLHVLISNINSEETDSFFSKNALVIGILGTVIWGFGDLLNLVSV